MEWLGPPHDIIWWIRGRGVRGHELKIVKHLAGFKRWAMFLLLFTSEPGADRPNLSPRRWQDQANKACMIATVQVYRGEINGKGPAAAGS